MKIQVYCLSVCLGLSHGMCAMHSLERAVGQMERIVVDQSRAGESTEAIMVSLKNFLSDSTLSSDATHMLQEMLIENLSSYPMRSYTSCMPSDNRTIIEYSSIEHVDGTHSFCEVETELCLDRSEMRILKAKQRSPWHSLSLESVIKIFLQSYKRPRSKN